MPAGGVLRRLFVNHLGGGAATDLDAARFGFLRHDALKFDVQKPIVQVRPGYADCIGQREGLVEGPTGDTAVQEDAVVLGGAL